MKRFTLESLQASISKNMKIKRDPIVVSSVMLGAVALAYGSLVSDVSAQTKTEG